jgi:hypothetical protein
VALPVGSAGFSGLEGGLPGEAGFCGAAGTELGYDFQPERPDGQRRYYADEFRSPVYG